MRRERERYIKVVDLELSPIPKNAEKFDVREFIWRISSIADRPTATYLLERGNKVIWLAACSIISHEDSVFAVLLINSADDRVSSPTIANRKSRQTRDVRIENGESPAVSSHLLVHLIPGIDGINPHYWSYLEESPGLSKTSVAGFLTFLSKVAFHGCKIKLPNKEGKLTNYETRPLIRIHDCGAESLSRVYAGRSVDYVEMYEVHDESLIDCGKVLVPKSNTYKLVPTDKNKVAGDIIKEAISIFSGKNNKSSRLMVKLAPQVKGSKPEYLKYSKSEDEDDDKVDQIISSFSRQYRVELRSKHAQCDSLISNEIVDEMVGIAYADIMRS